MLPKKIIKGKKNCTKCKKWVLLSGYNKGKAKDGTRSQCRDCSRDYKIMFRYGLTEEQVIDFWDRNKCELCGRDFINSSLGKGRFKCIDHDHTTGKARGILCNACNAGLGYFSDNIERLKLAISYLDGNGSLLASLEKEIENDKH